MYKYIYYYLTLFYELGSFYLQNMHIILHILDLYYVFMIYVVTSLCFIICQYSSFFYILFKYIFNFISNIYIYIEYYI